MTSGKYFNRAVIALDAPHIGYVVRETDDKIVVFGEGKQRYDIPLSEIKTVSKNVLVGLNFEEIAKKYSVERDAPLPTSKYVDPWGADDTTDFATYVKEYAKTLFNKGVRIENEDTNPPTLPISGSEANILKVSTFFFTNISNFNIFACFLHQASLDKELKTDSKDKSFRVCLLPLLVYQQVLR